MFTPSFKDQIKGQLKQANVPNTTHEHEQHTWAGFMENGLLDKGRLGTESIRLCAGSVFPGTLWEGEPEALR